MKKWWFEFLHKTNKQTAIAIDSLQKFNVLFIFLFSFLIPPLKKHLKPHTKWLLHKEFIRWHCSFCVFYKINDDHSKLILSFIYIQLERERKKEDVRIFFYHSTKHNKHKRIFSHRNEEKNCLFWFLLFNWHWLKMWCDLIDFSRRY